MKVISPFQINDWPIKKFLIIILTFQLLFWGSICLDFIGFEIPLLRQLACFLYLTFIPGILMLRALRLHRLGCIESLLYTVGLSLSILMFIGFFTNKLYPLIGISKPISIIPLMITMSFITLLLSGVCYLIDRNFSHTEFLNLDGVFSASSLFICLIPIWTIIGTFLVNFYNDNFLLIIIIFMLSLIVVLVSFNYIPCNLYPLAIFITSLSLLFHNSLVSMHITGWDIQEEYFVANKVITDSLWNSSLYSSINSMLSIVMLAPIYSVICSLSLTWVFKIIYPAVFSLTPLGIYIIVQKQTNDKIAFMSTFFFMSVFVFYVEMLQLARQQIAEYFLVLIILLLIQNKNDVSNRILLILFSFSVIISHYGVSYIFLFSIICSLFILFIFGKYLNNSSKNGIINFGFTSLIITFLLAWYMYTSKSLLYDILHVMGNILDHFRSDFLNPNEAQGLNIITKQTNTPLHEFARYMHIFTQLCISIGLCFTIKRTYEKKSNFNPVYLSLSAVFYMVLVAAIAIPNFASALNTSRIYHITLILLAPFCVIGGITLLTALSKGNSRLKTDKNNVLTLKTLSIFFAVFMLFNTGWIYEISGDSPTSFSLDHKMDYPKFNDRDIAGKEWLNKVNGIEENSGFIYADYYRQLLFSDSFRQKKIRTFPKNIDLISKDSYLYFSAYNIKKNKILINHDLDYRSYDPYISSNNEIYNNDGAKIYYQ